MSALERFYNLAQWATCPGCLVNRHFRGLLCVCGYIIISFGVTYPIKNISKAIQLMFNFDTIDNIFKNGLEDLLKPINWFPNSELWKINTEEQL